MFKFLAAALLAGAAFADFETEENVLVLTDDNLDDAIETYENILVEFYAPWCGHCKQLAPNYAAAATFFEENDEFDVKLGKVDATENNDIAQQYGVSGYPTIKFFKNGEVMEYSGGRSEDEIIAWLKKKTGPAAVTIEDAEKFEELTGSDDVVVVLAASDITEENENVAAFLKIAATNDDVIFGLTTDHSIIGEEADSVVLFKPFDEKRVKFEEKVTKSKLNKFIGEHLLPTVIEFNDNVAAKVFGGAIQQHILYFRDASADGDDAVLDAYRAVAQVNKGDLLFVAVDLKQASNKRIAEFFGISTDTEPTVRIIDISGNPLKYAPDSFEDATEEAFAAFVKSYLAGDLEPHLKSEEIPDGWDEDDVKIVVGKNYKDVVLDETKNVFLMAHAPWCGHCKSLMPVWDELAETFEENDSVIIAKMDATANEIADLNVQGFPTLKFFPAGSKEILDYEGGRDLEALTTYVNEKSAEVAANESEEAEVATEEAKDDAKDEL